MIFGILCASALCENITPLSSVVTSNSLDVSKCTPIIYFPSRPTSKHESMSYSTAENKHLDTLYTNNQHKCLKMPNSKNIFVNQAANSVTYILALI